MRHPEVSDEAKITMVKLVYFTDLSYSEIARQCHTSAASVARYALNVLSPVQVENRVVRLKRELHEEHMRSNLKAYIYVEAPDWYIGETNYGKATEHVINWCKANGQTHVEPGYIIHHLDHDRRNNHHSNLEKMTRGEHVVHHKPQRRKLAC